MTSTISFNKEKRLSNGKSMLLWSIKRNKAPMIVLTALLTVILPLAVIFVRTMYYSYTQQTPDIAFDAREGYVILMTASTIFDTVATFIVMAFSVIFALNAFKYMHNKRTVDMFGSLPVNRRTMFFSQLVGAVACTLLPVFTVIAVTMLLAIPHGEVALCLFIELLYLSLGVIANIAFIGLLSVCCGTVKDTVISYITISIVYPLTVALCVAMPSQIIPGVANTAVDMTAVTALCPFASPFVVFAKSGWGASLLRYSMSDVLYSSSMISSLYVPSFDIGKAYDAVHIVYWVLFTAVCITLSHFLVRKRKAESAQSGFAFSFPQIIIRLITDFVAGLIAGEMLSSISFSANAHDIALMNVWFFIGVAVGSISAHLLLQLLYFKGFKGFLKSLISCGCAAASVFVLYIVLITGGLGTDVYIPNPDEVESVAFCYCSCGADYSDGYDADIENVGNFEQISGVTDKEYIKTVTDIHGMITNNLRQSDHYPYSPYLGGVVYNEGEGYDNEVIIEYKLKNGSTVKRSYAGWESGKKEIDDSARNLSTTGTYQRSLSGIDNLDNASFVDSIDISLFFDEEYDEYYNNYNRYNSYHIDTVDIGGDNIKELIKTLQAEYPSSADPIKSEKANMYIRFNYTDENGLHNFTRDIAIRETYKNTIALLEKLGLTNEAVCMDFENYGNEGEIKYPDSFINGGAKGEYLYIKVPKDFAQGDNVYCRPYYDGGRVITKPLSDEEKCEYVSEGLYRIKLYDRAKEYGSTVGLTDISVYTFDKDNVSKTYSITPKIGYTNGITAEVVKDSSGDYYLYTEKQ